MSTRPPAKEPRPPASNAALAGRTIVVVLIAAAIGLLILKNAYDDSSVSAVENTTTSSSSTSVLPETTTTTVNMAGVKIIVANAAGVSGAAGRMSTQLQGLGYSVLEPTNATSKGLDTTFVYHIEGFEQQAAKVAADIGAQPGGLFPGASLVPDIGDANVIVVLGTDLATSAGATTTAAGAGTGTTTTAAGTTTTTG